MADTYSQKLRDMISRARDDINRAYVLGQEHYNGLPQSRDLLPPAIIFPSAFRSEPDLKVTRKENESAKDYMLRMCRIYCEWRMGEVYKAVMYWPEPKEIDHD